MYKKGGKRMPNYAKVALTGRLTREPRNGEYNGSTVISFSVAVYTTKKVDDKYVADFYNVSFWGKAAEAVYPKLAQGTLVQVYGDLYQEDYTDKQGNKKQGMSVRASEVIKLKDPEENKETKPKAKPKAVEEDDPF